MISGGSDSKFGLSFLKFWHQNSFSSKFGLKKSKLFVLPENWHTWYLGRAGSKSGVKFLKFRPPKSIFRQVWAKKTFRLFSFETLLLLLDIQLVLELYLKIPLHSAAAFYKRFWKYEVTKYLLLLFLFCVFEYLKVYFYVILFHSENLIFFIIFRWRTNRRKQAN